NNCDFFVYVFFFQAEDGIRDDLVTGVQTCALPISIMNKGRIIATGTPAEIRGRLRATHVVIVKTAEDPEEFHAYGRVLRAGASLRILTDRDGARALTSWCVSSNLEVSVRQVSVEDVFIGALGLGVDAEPA